jgi:hypothetical protein
LLTSRTTWNGDRQPVTPVAPAPIDPRLTVFQVANILDETIGVLEIWRKHPGRGPEFIRYPTGEVRYRLSAVMKFIEEHTVRH